jgi:hypothetical protein
MDKLKQIISSAFNTVFTWIEAHPKAALVGLIFIIGFIAGLLF